jgi:hypothetical protein
MKTATEVVPTASLEREVRPVVAWARALVVRSPEQYVEASDGLKRVKEAVNRVVEFFRPMKSRAHDAWMEIRGTELELLAPLQEAESEVKQLMARFTEIENRKRQAEEDRLRHEAEQRAEAERKRLLAQAKAAAAAKAPNKSAELVRRAEAVEVAHVHVPERVPIVEGVQARKVWELQSVSKRELIQAAASNLDLERFLKVDEQAVRQAVIASGGALAIPGVVAVQVTQIASGRNGR